MEQESQSLEDSLGSPSWDQWIPVYGYYRVASAESRGVPGLCDDRDNHPIRHRVSAVYHGTTFAVVGMSAIYGASYLCYLGVNFIENLF